MTKIAFIYLLSTTLASCPGVNSQLRHLQVAESFSMSMAAFSSLSMEKIIQFDDVDAAADDIPIETITDATEVTTILDPATTMAAAKAKTKKSKSSKKRRISQLRHLQVAESISMSMAAFSSLSMEKIIQFDDVDATANDITAETVTDATEVAAPKKKTKKGKSLKKLLI